MPRYQLRFRIETCLIRGEDVTLEFSGYSATLLFKEKGHCHGHVIARIEVDAPNSHEAQATVSGTVLPPILDALSFATGTPLLLRHCELVLKSQRGDKRRRGLYIGQQHNPTPSVLTNTGIAKAEKILNNGNDLRLPLCWHNHALDRQLDIDQFVFNWLAFEALAGKVKVPNRCPKCQTEMKHCDTVVTHAGSDKMAARKIYQAAHPTTEDKEFNDDIWGNARNSVFHGSKYPEPKYLAELKVYSNKIRTAVDRRIDTALELERGSIPNRGYETWNSRPICFEWATNAPSDEFSTDWPASQLVEMTDEENAEGPGHKHAQAKGVTLLDIQDLEDW